MTMTSPSEDEDFITIDDEDDEIVIKLTRDECIALMDECAHSYISYENPIAVSVIRRIRKFADSEV